MDGGVKSVDLSVKSRQFSFMGGHIWIDRKMKLDWSDHNMVFLVGVALELLI